MKFFSRALALMVVTLALSLSTGVVKVFAQQAAEEGTENAPLEPMSDAEKQWRSVQWEGAGTDARLGDEAHVKVPDGYIFTGRTGTQTLMKLYGNLLTEMEQGYIEPEDENAKWFMVFEYESSGHVKDDEKSDLDADALLKSLKDSDEAENAERAKLGHPPLNTLGWLVPPYYNETTHNLEWALLLESQGEKVVNYNIRLLGREGIMHVTVVTGADEFDKIKDKVPAVLDGFAFNPGRTYAEYREGDKLADYGLMALLGVGALGVGATIFSKFGKVIFVGIAAAAAGAFSFVRRLFGRGKKAKTDTEDRINKLNK